MTAAVDASRTKRSDWLREGLAVLRDEGPGALTIAAMCKRLGRTKGAFYHHFDSAEVFQLALLQHWQEQLTLAPIAVAQQGTSAEQRRRRLATAVQALDTRLDLAVRAWAGKDMRAAEMLAQVDRQRVGYLEELHAQEHGKGKVARVLAQIEYAAFVGAQQLFSDMSDRAAGDLNAALNRALLLLGKDLQKRP